MVTYSKVPKKGRCLPRTMGKEFIQAASDCVVGGCREGYVRLGHVLSVRWWRGGLVAVTVKGAHRFLSFTPSKICGSATQYTCPIIVIFVINLPLKQGAMGPICDGAGSSTNKIKNLKGPRTLTLREHRAPDLKGRWRLTRREHRALKKGPDITARPSLQNLI